MDEKQIVKVKQMLMDWNPLGERASEIKDLDNYQTEAVDILFCIDKKSSTDNINKRMVGIISEAFDVHLDLKKTKKYAEIIRSIINNE